MQTVRCARTILHMEDEKAANRKGLIEKLKAAKEAAYAKRVIAHEHKMKNAD